MHSLTAGHFVYLRPWQTVWSRKNFENVVFRYVQQAQRMFPLQMQNNFYNRTAFLNKHQILSTRFDVAFCGNSVNKFHCRVFSLFETMTRGSQIKTLAIEPNRWDRSTNIKHQIPSRSLKECFSRNPGNSPDCRAFIHSRFNLCTQL